MVSQYYYEILVQVVIIWKTNINMDIICKRIYVSAKLTILEYYVIPSYTHEKLCDIYTVLCLFKCVCSVLASVFAMAVPPVPSASLVLVVIICTTLNIPTESIALLVAVEWLL